MRIIKFRAWSKTDDKMLDVLALKDDKGYVWLQAYIQPKTIYRVMPNFVELMQFTGLTDKNGKEIWEGDLIRYSIQGDIQGEPMEVKIPGIFIELGHDDRYYLPDQKSFEVIGNIWENPELLKI